MTQHHEGVKPASDLAILRWQRLMEQALTSLHCSDEAPGLLASGTPAWELIACSAGWRDTTLPHAFPL
jgi:hypothetical protein